MRRFRIESRMTDADEEGQFNEKSSRRKRRKKCHSKRLIPRGHSKLDLESPDEDHYSIESTPMMRRFRIKSKRTDADEEGQFNEKSSRRKCRKKRHSARLILGGHSKLDLESPDEDNTPHGYS